MTSTVLEEWRSATEPEEGEPPVLARAAGLVVFVADRALLVGDRARGALYEDRHTGVPWSVPGTTGTVERVRLVTRGHRRVGRRELVPVHGTEELTDVDLAPGTSRTIRNRAASSSGRRPPSSWSTCGSIPRTPYACDTCGG